jgi:RHS repeat-associated protein
MPKVEEPTVTEKKHVEVRFSGDDLLLNDKGEIVGQTLSLASGVAVGLNGAGAPVAWNYPNVMGNTTWRSGENAIPSATILYDPWGTKISMDPPEEPTSAVALVMDGQGWGAGQGGVTLPLATGLVTLGSRTYVPELGRFIQADPQDGTNAYAYADNDPIDNTDSSGNSVTAGDIFSWIFSIGLGIVIGALAPVTLGGSSVLAGVVFTAVAASLDFVGSVAGQLIDNGGNFSQINWAQAGINAGIGAGLVGGGFVIGRLAIYPIRMGAKLAAQSRRAAALNMLLPGEESLAARGGWKVGARSYLTWGGSHGEATGLQRFVRLMRGGNRPPPAPTGIAMEDLLNPAYVENLFDGLKPGAMGTKESIKMGSGGVQQVAQVQNPVVASQRSSSSSLAKSLQIDDAEYQKMLRDFIKAHGYS